MNNEARQRALEIFEQASERGGAERARWLDEACAGDAELRELVERLLRADEQPGPLDRPPVPGDDDIAGQLGRALGDRYVIHDLIGRGGSAAVFLAEERKHSRRVVLKVLDPEVAELWGADRFQREVQIAARLAHPHIVGLIDSGDADGLLYYVMPFVEGETLRARLDRTGPLPYAEALPLLRDIADALAHAHAAGVVHRDLKPANVLCVGRSRLPHGFRRGEAGATGPPGRQDHRCRCGRRHAAYMAPEQRAAVQQLDHKVDLYAWGLLAAEVLSGKSPRDMKDTTRELGDAPPGVVQLVSDCLAKDPAARPADAGILLRQLDPGRHPSLPVRDCRGSTPPPCAT